MSLSNFTVNKLVRAFIAQLTAALEHNIALRVREHAALIARPPARATVRKPAKSKPRPGRKGPKSKPRVGPKRAPPTPPAPPAAAIEEPAVGQALKADPHDSHHPQIHADSCEKCRKWLAANPPPAPAAKSDQRDAAGAAPTAISDQRDAAGAAPTAISDQQGSIVPPQADSGRGWAIDDAKAWEGVSLEDEPEEPAPPPPPALQRFIDNMRKDKERADLDRELEQTLEATERELAGSTKEALGGETLPETLERLGEPPANEQAGVAMLGPAEIAISGGGFDGAPAFVPPASAPAARAEGALARSDAPQRRPKVGETWVRRRDGRTGEVTDMTPESLGFFGSVVQYQEVKSGRRASLSMGAFVRFWDPLEEEPVAAAPPAISDQPERPVVSELARADAEELDVTVPGADEDLALILREDRDAGARSRAREERRQELEAQSEDDVSFAEFDTGEELAPPAPHAIERSLPAQRPVQVEAIDRAEAADDAAAEETQIASIAKAREKATVAADGRVRAKTLSGVRLTKEERRAAALIVYPDVERPLTREDCANMPRPCPFVGCAHHLYLDINSETGNIKLNFPHLEVWEMPETCSLDVADRGGITLEEVGAILNLTRERIRQVEVRGLVKIRHQSGEALGITDPSDQHERLKEMERRGTPLAEEMED